LQVLDLDAGAGGLEHQVVNQLVVQLVDAVPRRFPFRVDRVQLRLDVQRLNQRVRIEEQLQNRQQQPPQPANDAAMRLEKRVFAELIVGPLGRRRRLAEVLEQVGADRSRVEKLLELDRGELANLLLGVVDAALLADPCADLL